MVVRRMGESNSQFSGCLQRRGIRRWRKRFICVTAITGYLLAISSANILVSVYGINILPFTALVLIPFDMTARNVLHEIWSGQLLVLKMGLLVFIGSLLSFATGGSDLAICVASFISFASAALVDSVIYQSLIQKMPMIKMNTSNGAAAITDSIVFPLIAFGFISIPIMVAQSIMKFTGGFIWSLFTKQWIEKVRDC